MLTLLVALDKPVAVAALVAAVICVVLVLRKRRGAGYAVVFLLVGALFGGRVLAQGASAVAGDPEQTGLTMLSWNAQGVPTAQIASRLVPAVRERRVDVVVLPETGGDLAQQVSDELARQGWAHEAFITSEDASVLMVTDLARRHEYRTAGPVPAWAGLQVEPATPSAEAPMLLAVHVQRPSPGNESVRKEHLEWVRTVCDTAPFAVAIGDFNATLNHLADARIGRCADVAAAVGAGAASTWPTSLPPWLGISIDRVLVSPAFEPARASFEVLRDVPVGGADEWGDGQGADHWPILVTLPA